MSDVNVTSIYSILEINAKTAEGKKAASATTHQRSRGSAASTNELIARHTYPTERANYSMGDKVINTHTHRETRTQRTRKIYNISRKQRQKC